MNNSIVLTLIIGTAILTVLLGVIAIYVANKNKGQKRETDYRAFFILGISFLPIGIATENPGLWGMGAVFLAIGLANRSKWKDEPKWSELDPVKRRTKILIIVGLTVLLLASLGVYIFTK